MIDLRSRISGSDPFLVYAPYLNLAIPHRVARVTLLALQRTAWGSLATLKLDGFTP
jgi:hypothetical protein